MLKEVRWSDEAILDMSNITDYLLYKWNADITNSFLDNIEVFIKRIRRNSRAFPLINTNEGIRKCVVSKHNSVYYADEIEYVEILRIFDNRQDPQRLDFLK